jgi:hypothetical protein
MQRPLRKHAPSSARRRLRPRWPSLSAARRGPRGSASPPWRRATWRSLVGGGAACHSACARGPARNPPPPPQSQPGRASPRRAGRPPPGPRPRVLAAPNPRPAPRHEPPAAGFPWVAITTLGGSVQVTQLLTPPCAPPVIDEVTLAVAGRFLTTKFQGAIVRGGPPRRGAASGRGPPGPGPGRPHAAARALPRPTIPHVPPRCARSDIGESPVRAARCAAAPRPPVWKPATPCLPDCRRTTC